MTELGHWLLTPNSFEISNHLFLTGDLPNKYVYARHDAGATLLQVEEFLDCDGKVDLKLR